MNELAGDDGAVGVDLLGEGPKRWNDAVVPVVDVAGTPGRGWMDARSPEGLHHRRTPFRLLHVIADIPVRGEAIYAEVSVVRGADDPILQDEAADGKRRKESGKGRGVRHDLFFPPRAQLHGECAATRQVSVQNATSVREPRLDDASSAIYQPLSILPCQPLGSPWSQPDDDLGLESSQSNQRSGEVAGDLRK